MSARKSIAALLVLVLTAAPVRAGEPKTLLLIGQGPDGHPPQTHEYMAGIEQLTRLLEPTEGLRIRVAKADEPWSDGPRLLSEADGAALFLSEGARWIDAQPRRYEALARLAARGGGLVALHWALGTKAAEPIGPFLKLFGGCHGGPDRKYQVVDTALRFVDPPFPLRHASEPFRVRDEFYYRLKFAAPAERIHPVLQATIDRQDETVAWTFERADGGRSFGFTGLHFHENWQVPQYRELVSRAVRWTMKLPGD